jgi:hypothetical protein
MKNLLLASALLFVSTVTVVMISLLRKESLYIDLPQTTTMQQAESEPSPCGVAAMSATVVRMDYRGGNGSFIYIPEHRTNEASTTAPWVVAKKAPRGGNDSTGSVGFTVLGNFSADTREGVIHADGKDFTIIQCGHPIQK